MGEVERIGGEVILPPKYPLPNSHSEGVESPYQVVPIRPYRIPPRSTKLVPSGTDTKWYSVPYGMGTESYHPHPKVNPPRGGR